jgi:hypothetical protein
VVDAEVWNFAGSELAYGHWQLLGLWGEPAAVHMAILDDRVREIAVVSLQCLDGVFPSIGRYHPPALRLERTICDLFGLVADGAPDAREWLDHGAWGFQHPLGDRITQPPQPMPYRFLAAEGPGLHQIAVGPVHAGIIEPGHFRFTASGETVVRLEQRLGYTHKGIEGLMTGADPLTPQNLPAASPETARSLMALRSQAVEAALGLMCRRARLAAGAALRTGAARQSSRRHRRDLQRRIVRADAGPLQCPPRAGLARSSHCVRPPPDAGRHRSRRRRS